MTIVLTCALLSNATAKLSPTTLVVCFTDHWSFASLTQRLCGQALDISGNPLSATAPAQAQTFWEIWYNAPKPAHSSDMYAAPAGWSASAVSLLAAQQRLMRALMLGMAPGEAALIVERQQANAAAGLRQHVQEAACVADVDFLAECLRNADQVRCLQRNPVR